MRQHDSFGFGANCRLNLACVNVVCNWVYIDKDWNCAKLDNRIHGGRKARSHANNLISLAYSSLPEFWGSQGTKSHQIRR
jgi:hypothetical protein